MVTCAVLVSALSGCSGADEQDGGASGDQRGVGGTETGGSSGDTGGSSTGGAMGTGGGIEGTGGGFGSGGADGAGGVVDAGGGAGGTGGAGDTGGTSGGKFVGNITTNNAVRADFLDYWDQLTPENESKWSSVEGQRDQMNWSTVDKQYEFAKENNIPFKFHTMVWGSQYPNWITGLSQAEQKEEIEEWIQAICTRYPDLPLIDVVNEPDHAPPPFAAALGGGGMGGNYAWIVWSFQKARQYCPNSTLILNDYNVLRWDTNNFINIVNKVKEAGAPIDAVGCQAHSLESQSLNELKANLEKIVALGLKVYISEYDIDEADDTKQKDIMSQQFPVFYESPAVEGITLWGYVVGATWRANTGLMNGSTPRPAMTWLMDYLGR